MDPVSIATALVGAQMSGAQMAVAARMLRMNADNAASIVQVLNAAQQNMASLANVASGIGQNLNIVCKVAPGAYWPSAALISLIASSLAHSAGPAIVPISQPCPSINSVVGMPKARPMDFKSWNVRAVGSA